MKIENEVVVSQMKKRVNDLEDELEKYKIKFGDKIIC